MRSIARPLWLVPLTLFLCGLTYLVGTPLGGAPDEFSHFVRTVGLSQGVLLGDAVPPDTPYGAFQGENLRSVNLEARFLDAPAGLRGLVDCLAQQTSDEAWGCPDLASDDSVEQFISHHATSSPLPYVVPALASRLASAPTTRFYLARLGFLIQNTLLVVLAVAALGRARLRWTPITQGAAVLCVTPVFLWQTGLVSPNSTEVYALVAFSSTVVATLRNPTSRWWQALTAVGVCAIWCRDLDFIYVPSILLIPLVFRNGRFDARLVPLRSRLSLLLIIGCAAFGAMWWKRALAAPIPDLDLSPSSLWLRIERLRTLSIDSIGRLGILDIATQPVVAVVWPIAFVAIWAALVVRSRHWRLVLLIASCYWTIANVVLNLVISARGFTWFGTQARYTIFLPLVCLLIGLGTAPKAVGESGFGNRGTTDSVVWGSAFVAAACHFLTFVHVHHRWANGLGHEVNFRNTNWAPPGGWVLTFILTVASTAMIIVAPACTRIGSAHRWQRGFN